MSFKDKNSFLVSQEQLQQEYLNNLRTVFFSSFFMFLPHGMTIAMNFFGWFRKKIRASWRLKWRNFPTLELWLTSSEIIVLMAEIRRSPVEVGSLFPFFVRRVLYMQKVVGLGIFQPSTAARNWGELGDFNDWLGSIKDKYQQPDGCRRKMGPYCKLWKDFFHNP